ncbi:hypothetical protein OJAV_G00075100 [Oryzias javanicus]|uniref:Uncharacterized protein n=1 Tax=Oryzias javanicus TaxID=123683 RepID=A0A437D2E1_ORYJA|nr:hypothetical protein OJAV_G00075100 [Oryzias javanicus]
MRNKSWLCLTVDGRPSEDNNRHLTSSLISCHVHEEPTSAPALSGTRLAQADLQKPLCQTEGRRIVSFRGGGCTQTPLQACRSSKRF